MQKLKYGLCRIRSPSNSLPLISLAIFILENAYRLNIFILFASLALKEIHKTNTKLHKCIFMVIDKITIYVL